MGIYRNGWIKTAKGTIIVNTEIEMPKQLLIVEMVPVERWLVLHLEINHYYYVLPNLMLVKNLVVNKKMAIPFAGVQIWAQNSQLYFSNIGIMLLHKKLVVKSVLYIFMGFTYWFQFFNLKYQKKNKKIFAGVILIYAIRVQVSNVYQTEICLIAKMVFTKKDLQKKLLTVEMVLVEKLLVPNWDQNHYTYVVRLLKMVKKLVVLT